MTPLFALILLLLHLPLLPAQLYLCAGRRLCRGLPLSPLDLLLPVVQAANLSLLCAALDRPAPPAALPLQLLLLAAFAGRLLWSLRRWGREQTGLRPQSLRAAIDRLPDGLCFAAPDGRPILVNTQMDQLLLRLTGKPLLDARSAWEALEAFSRKQPAPPWSPPPEGGLLDLVCPDGSRWRFRREQLLDRQPHYIQLTAWDITALFEANRQLYETNQRLTAQQARLRDLLEHIVELNREKEVLAFKSRLHDDFGQCLLTTRRYLSGQAPAHPLPQLTALWRQAIGGLASIPAGAAVPDSPPEEELCRTAELIGCRVMFRGGDLLPRGTMSLVCAAAREALTNGVRHARATQVTVEVTPGEAGFHVEIWDNGQAVPATQAEGEGLSNLRKKLEREGVLFQIQWGRGVRLILDLPAAPDRKEDPV